MRPICLAFLMILLTASSASAQQVACRYSHRTGEYVPAGCLARQNPGARVYEGWSGNFGSGASSVPRAAPPHRDWRYFGGYNALYGFGR